MVPHSTREGSTRRLRAQGVEFVARPGHAAKLQKAIAAAKRNAQETCDGFVGSLVFVSEQEERLVTIVTLWDGTEEARQREEDCEELKKLLEPHVDSWLRAGKFTTFFSMPELFCSARPENEGQATMANRVACH